MEVITEQTSPGAMPTIASRNNVQATPLMNLTNELAAAFASAITTNETSPTARSESVLDPRPESRKTAMAAHKPFWTLRVHEKRDVLIARQKARQIAHLLHFAPLEEACVAAGVFAIAAQARDQLEIAEICFHLENNQLVVCAKPLGGVASDNEIKTPLLKLAKPLPDAAREFSVDELAFLIGQINDQAPTDLYGELSKQNQEILLLLHLLNHSGDQLNQKSPSAA